MLTWHNYADEQQQQKRPQKNNKGEQHTAVEERSGILVHENISKLLHINYTYLLTKTQNHATYISIHIHTYILYIYINMGRYLSWIKHIIRHNVSVYNVSWS